MPPFVLVVMLFIAESRALNARIEKVPFLDQR
jgi:hypothetical protein